MRKRTCLPFDDIFHAWQSDIHVSELKFGLKFKIKVFYILLTHTMSPSESHQSGMTSGRPPVNDPPDEELPSAAQDPKASKKSQNYKTTCLSEHCTGS